MTDSDQSFGPVGELPAASAFLRCLYGDEAPGYLVLWTKQDKQTHAGSAANAAGAGTYAVQLASSMDVYFGVGLQGEKPQTGRGTAEGVVAIPGLWVDVDVQGPGHKADDLPPTIEDAQAFVQSFPLPPTIMVASGGGLHVYWLFRELWTLESPAERQDAQRLARRFQATLIAAARERGWKLDNTSDLARVLRVPGTMNRKSEPVEVRILELHDDRRYNPDEFDLYLVELDTAPAADMPAPHDAESTEEYPPAKLEPMCKGCAWLTHCRDDAKSLSEPEWYAMLSILGRTDAGEQSAHEWSKPHPNYSIKETASKLQQAVAASGPRTCADIRAIGGEPYCSNCKHWERIPSPIVLGMPQKATRTDLPKIDAGSGNLAEIAGQAWEAVKASNNPPYLFQRGNLMTRIKTGDVGEPFLAVVPESGLRGILARTAWWYRWAGRGEDKYMIDALPPTAVVKDMQSAPEMTLPMISRIVEAPVFGHDGQLETSPGYHASSRTFYWDSGLRFGPVPERPAVSDVDRAKTLIVDDLLGDFPFTSESELAHSVAAMLAPFVREMIAGPTPLHMIEAPTPGTGKSYLADAISIPSTGRPSATTTEGRDEDEWRKRITASLLAAPTFLLIDNVRRKLDSAALSAALTSQAWQDRILGRSELTTLPVRTVWLATGNNPALTTEMARRTVRIRLDAKTARPWQRSGFRHKDLRGWASANRGDLVWAALTLVQTWIAKGMPPGDYVLGQYESWARVIGGILDSVGIPGFLANANEVYAAADEETQQWEEFLATWWDEHRDAPQNVRELFRIASERDLLLLVRGFGKEHSQKIKLGVALGQMNDRRIGEWCIKKAGNDRTKATLYQVVLASEPYTAPLGFTHAAAASEMDSDSGVQDGEPF